MNSSFKNNTAPVELVTSKDLEDKDVSAQVVSSDSLRILKRGIWLYFILLILEGALRKWFLPELSAPLLIIRDPLALWLIIYSLRKELLPFSFYLSGMVIVGILGIATALLVGHGNLYVSLFGARILLLHFPLIFIIGNIFNREDVVKIGRVIIWISIPMAILIALQFYSPQSAWVNRGVGGDMAGAGFSGAMGYFRPPGTFSFTNGTSFFFGILACFVFYFWVSSERINRFILIGGTLALLASIPLSISRTLFFSIIVSLIFTIIAISKKPEYISKILGATICVVISLVVLSQTEFFQTATKAFTSRFETASKIEGGVESTLVDRYLGGMIAEITENDTKSFFGYGIGMGTNAGSAMLTGDRSFLIAEGEWGRLIGEMGMLMGLAVIFIRLGFCLAIAIASLRRLSSGDLLPWILLSFGLLIIPQGQWAQPTALGFSTLIGGLILASLNQEKS